MPHKTEIFGQRNQPRAVLRSFPNQFSSLRQVFINVRAGDHLYGRHAAGRGCVGSRVACHMKQKFPELEAHRAGQFLYYWKTTIIYTLQPATESFEIVRNNHAP
ncbi:Uncharacterised protein [Bordetella pertussis]|nr:Uncharacterised protein [Bordetella pertussis]CPK51506.1 Uncharacterised protein [Bordetella pertussis]